MAVTAEASEPVMQWHVAEGDRVDAGAVVLELDARRQDARIAEQEAQLAAMEAQFAEATNGARIETIDAQRANLARARAQTDAGDGVRASSSCVSASSWPSRSSTKGWPHATSGARRRKPPRRSCASSTAGTRPEQVEQAAASVAAAARASLDTLKLTRERLTVRAPRAGRIDALPFRAGDQPPLGAELVSMLVGDEPYARVFVPAPRRTELKIGSRFESRSKASRRRSRRRCAASAASRASRRTTRSPATTRAGSSIAPSSLLDDGAELPRAACR